MYCKQCGTPIKLKNSNKALNESKIKETINFLHTALLIWL